MEVKMPIPQNWSEELVFEWLCLEGYSTEVGIKVGTGGQGSRKEADVVGVKTLTIWTIGQHLADFLRVFGLDEVPNI